MSSLAHVHPVLACADAIEAALKDVADVDPVFMTTDDKATALLRLGARLACTANIVPAVLGGDSHVLDLGRTRRLFSPAQRKAMALRYVTCRAEGCDVPAAWCEAPHAGRPWAAGGRTDVADGVLLCSFHPHRAHDERYDCPTRSHGRLTFHRRP